MVSSRALYRCLVAAEKGLARAQSNLGDMYANGKGVTQDYVEAIRWYRKAAKQGDAYRPHGDEPASHQVYISEPK